MTQCERVLKYIDDFGSITSLQAFADLGVTRLAACIFKLKKAGIEIESEMQTGINRYGESTRFAKYRRA